MTQLFSGDTDILAELRRLMPNRPITETEARAVAERQAARLLRLMHVDHPPVPMFVVSSLAGISVDWRDDWPTSAMAVAHDGGWRIVLRSNDTRPRQRFSLVHEFKHILDDPYVKRLYRHLPPERRRRRAEAICDFFAACLMMPRVWIKRDFGRGITGPEALARGYFMSEPAMRRRLADLGLLGTHNALPEAKHQPPWSHDEREAAHA